ncbi:MAG TPA: AsmA family protein [Casimicrobiaceae bacterium]|nr:AsmA family protein [Casimicrobiaceae bacterium]
MAHRRALAALAALILVPLLLLGAAVGVVQSEWGERWAEGAIARRIDREVQIEDVDVDLGWPPAVHLGRLRVGNPAWATTPDLIDAYGVHAVVEVLPLLRRKLVLPFLSARKATAGLESDAGRATWRFGGDGQGESPFVVGRIDLDEGAIVYRDAEEQTDLRVDARGSAGPGGELDLRAAGRFRGEPTQATATIPALDPTPTAPIRVTGTARIGKTEMTVDGSFATSLDTIDARLGLSGATLRDLRKLAGLELPDTPPYRVDGQLRHTGQEWAFDPFKGKVGDSDLAGTATYRTDGARPRFHAQLRSTKLDLDDLGPLVGTPPNTGAGESASAEQRTKAEERKRASRVFGRDPIDASRWTRLDMDVTLEAKRVLRPQSVPLDALAFRAVLKDGQLRFDPLTFGVAGGRVRGTVALDGRHKPMRADVQLDAQGLKIARLFPKAETMQQSFGTVYGRAKLAGRGASVGEILGSSDGSIALAVDGGHVSLLLVEMLGLDVAEALSLLGTRNRQVTLRCAVADLTVKDGVASPQVFVIDTSDTVVGVTGTAHLGRERLDFVFRPEPKDPSIFALRSPIELTGTIKDPVVTPRIGPIAARVGAAALLAAVNPVLGILPFIETGPGEDTNCGALMAHAKSKGAVKKTP